MCAVLGIAVSHFQSTDNGGLWYMKPHAFNPCLIEQGILNELHPEMQARPFI